MAIRAILVSAAALALTTGCYFETIDERGEGSIDNDEGTGQTESNEGHCRATLAKGCFDGYLSPLQEIQVDGQSFFDASTLGGSFHKLIEVDGADGQPLEYRKNYTIEFTGGTLDNETFADGFSFVISGKTVETDELRSTGRFSINDLGTGSYDLRLQRPVKFDVVYQTTRPGPNDEPQQVTERQSRCATLYFDTTIDVRAAERSYDTFSAFNLHVTDEECSVDGRDSTITIPR